MTWTNTLPTVTGFYWFRDLDRMTPERGIALVDASKRSADIMIYPSDLDGEMYISGAYWTSQETTNANWEWYGPLSCPV